MSVKPGDCGKHGHCRRKVFQKVLAGLLTFTFTALVTVLLVWAILRPEKPRFVLQDVTVYAFNASVPNFLTSSFQITICSRNPNDKIGIYYDRLDVYATYNSQQITLRSRITPSYQDHEGVDVWSPLIYGTNVPVAPYNSLTLTQDQSAGSVNVLLKIDGRVRWKVGTFISGRYHLHVNCNALLTFGSQSSGITVGENAVKYQLVERCSVSV